MAVENQLSEKKQQPKFSVAIQSKSYQKLIQNTLGDSKRAARFIAAITSAVSNNAKLQECEVGTILSAALLGEALNLSPSPQLGQYYLVPYKHKKGKETISEAQFQLGYKGYLQLAIRSGYYKKINVLPIKVGELEYFDPLEEQIKIHMIEDEESRENADTIGVMGEKEWQKKECGKNIKKAGNAGIARDCEKKEKLIAILYGQGKKEKQERKREVKKRMGIF